MAIDWKRVESIGLRLLQVAATAEAGPLGAEAVQLATDLLGAGKELNALLKEVRDQTPENAAQVAEDVANDYKAAEDAWLASVKEHG